MTPRALSRAPFGASFANGVALSATGSTAYVPVDPPIPTTRYQLIAKQPGTHDDNVVMVGAHLDSAPAGPGIQYNGSGGSAILETAVQMAKVYPRNTIRFGWWGGEESGLVGSTAYVNGLSQEEQDDIVLSLTFDNISLHALDVNSDVVAAATLQVAMNTAAH